MKEIKFRAWDNEAEEFIYSDQQYDDAFFEFAEGTLKAYRIVLQAAATGEPSGWDHEEIGEPELYAGFKYANGVEVCEGDIVKTKNGELQIIEYSKVYSEFCYHWKLRCPKNSGWGFDFCNIREVVGNVNQNPELLEGK